MIVENIGQERGQVEIDQLRSKGAIFETLQVIGEVADCGRKMVINLKDISEDKLEKLEMDCI